MNINQDSNYFWTVAGYDDRPKNFCSVNSRLWPVKILGEKNLTYPCVIFYFVNLIVILQRDKTGE